MIDLHIHTKFSDGTNEVREILQMACDIGLDVISITDHDTCEAYRELEKLDVTSIYNGKIINGIEMSTSFNGYLIEILGYNFKNPIIINEYFKKSYKEKANQNDESKYLETVRNRILNLFDNLNINYDKNILKLPNTTATFVKKIYKSILENNDNLEEILKDDYCETPAEFYRKYITNPESKFFIDYGRFTLDIKSLIKLIHDNGGKVLLAHPLIYSVKDIESFICELKKIGLDGIEAYYSSFSTEEISYLLDFAHKNNLIVSGGSDFHGERRPNIMLGVGQGNLNIPKTIINY